MDLHEAISARILEAFEDRRVLEEARKALVDSISVASAAPYIESRSGRVARLLVADTSGPALVLGLWRKASRLGAAIANAFLAHSLEFDDWLAPGLVHAGSIVVPIVLSYAADKPLEDVLRIISASYEAALLAGGYFGRKHYILWHSTATVGAIVAAVAHTLSSASSINAERIAAAISVSAAYMGGMWRVNTVEALYKPLSPTHAVHTGIISSTIALLENKVIPGAIEEACKAMSGECKGLPKYGSRGIELNGYKFYPSCRHSHTAIEAAERIHERIGGLEASNVARISIYTFQEAIRIAGKREPRGISEARFSIPFLVAIALVYGKVNLRTISQGLKDENIAKIMEKTRLYEKPDYTKLYPYRQPAEVIVETSSGYTYKEVVEIPRGDPKRKPSINDILGKSKSLSEATGDERIHVLAEVLARANSSEKLEEILYSTT